MMPATPNEKEKEDIQPYKEYKPIPAEKTLEKIYTLQPLQKKRVAIEKLQLVKSKGKEILTVNEEKIKQQPAMPQKAEQQYTGQEIAISLDSVDIRTAMSTFSQISGANIIVDEGVNALISVNIGKPEPWDKIFRKILDDNLLDATFHENTIRVFNKSQIGGSK